VNKLEKIALGYILGIGIFTFVWFLLNWWGVPYNFVSGFTILLVLNAMLFVVNRIFGKKETEKSIKNQLAFSKWSFLEKFLLGIIIFLGVSAFIQSIYWPIRYWDSLVLYDFRAKVFAQTGFMDAAIAKGYFFSYPLLTSLAHTWIYVLGEKNPLFIYPLFYISLLILFFFNTQKLNIGRDWSLLLTAIVAESPKLFDHTQWAYTNLPYSIYLILASIYLYFGVKNKQLGSYVMSAFLIGLSTWTRTAEPFWISCVVVAVLAPVFFKKWSWPIIYVAIFTIIMIPWRVFQTVHQQGTFNVAGDLALTVYSTVNHLQVSDLISTFNFVMKSVVFNYKEFYVILIMILIGKLVLKIKDWTYTILVLLDMVIIFGGTLALVRSTIYWNQIPDSLARLAMFVPPMIIFMLAKLIAEIKNEKKF
jgi:hypothetical protein